MADINVGQLAEALNDKMDRDANNIESPKLSIFLVDVQYPTAENNYTWYRLYSDGWVEQGGYATAGQYNNGTVINLPVTMANANYTVLVAPKSNTHWSDDAMYNRNGTSQIIIYAGYNGGSGQNDEVCWEVKGMAAA